MTSGLCAAFPHWTDMTVKLTCAKSRAGWLPLRQASEPNWHQRSSIRHSIQRLLFRWHRVAATSEFPSARAFSLSEPPLPRRPHDTTGFDYSIGARCPAGLGERPGLSPAAVADLLPPGDRGGHRLDPQGDQGPQSVWPAPTPASISALVPANTHSAVPARPTVLP